MMKASRQRKRLEQLDRNLADAPVGNELLQTLRWHKLPARSFVVSGLPWLRENKGKFLRLPLRAKDKVREPVWLLSQCPSGGSVRWRTNSRRVAVRARIADTDWLSHMPASGVAGLELFGGEPFRLRPIRPAIPSLDRCEFTAKLVERSAPAWFEYQLQLPLYKGLDHLEIGLDSDAEAETPSPFAFPKPVVFYGTSITQGGCANTAGGDFVSTIGRMLHVETVNLGFSGNGKGEPEVAELIAEIDAGLFVIDYCNVSGAELAATLPPFLDILRARHPKTPILLKTTTVYPTYWHDASARSVIDARRDAVIRGYLQRKDAGDTNIHLADTFGMLPATEEGATVDACHPTSHGFHLLAKALAPVIEGLLFAKY